MCTYKCEQFALGKQLSQIISDGITLSLSLSFSLTWRPFSNEPAQEKYDSPIIPFGLSAFKQRGLLSINIRRARNHHQQSARPHLGAVRVSMGKKSVKDGKKSARERGIVGGPPERAETRFLTLTIPCRSRRAHGPVRLWPRLPVRRVNQKIKESEGCTGRTERAALCCWLFSKSVRPHRSPRPLCIDQHLAARIKNPACRHSSARPTQCPRRVRARSRGEMSTHSRAQVSIQHFDCLQHSSL